MFSYFKNLCRFSPGIGIHFHRAGCPAGGSSCLEMFRCWRTTAPIQMEFRWSDNSLTSRVSIKSFLLIENITRTILLQDERQSISIKLALAQLYTSRPTLQSKLSRLEVNVYIRRAIITEGRESGPSGLGTSSNYMLSTLSLSSARVEHGGRYECRATNNHGSVAHAARLNVYGKK